MIAATMSRFSLASFWNWAFRGDYESQWTRVLCVLFFFSGFPALIYQLTWQRALFRVFGVNIEAVTIVVTAFMLGLGLGSLLGGVLSKWQSIPLLPLLAAIELLTGAFGLVSLSIFDNVGALAAGLPLPLEAAAALGLVAVPTLLMGPPCRCSPAIWCAGREMLAVRLGYSTTSTPWARGAPV